MYSFFATLLPLMIHRSNSIYQSMLLRLGSRESGRNKWGCKGTGTGLGNDFTLSVAVVGHIGIQE